MVAIIIFAPSGLGGLLEKVDDFLCGRTKKKLATENEDVRGDD